MTKKTTEELLDSMKASRDYQEYLEANRENIGAHMRIDRALLLLLEEKCLKKADVIARSGMEVHYAYQIFSGLKTPTRDKVLMLCIGMRLTTEETQKLLRVSGYPPLYGKILRDNIVLFGITKGQSVLEINDTLYEQNLPLLV